MECGAARVTMAKYAPEHCRRQKNQSQTELLSSHWVAVWHQVGLHLLGIKSDTLKHKNPPGNSWPSIKLNSMWDKGKGFLEIKFLSQLLSFNVFNLTSGSRGVIKIKNRSSSINFRRCFSLLKTE